MIVHEDWQVCPDCGELEIPDPDCPLCDGHGIIDYEDRTDEGPMEPCPKCDELAYYRGPDHPKGQGLYCDHCGEVFHMARGEWPDILDHMGDG